MSADRVRSSLTATTMNKGITAASTSNNETRKESESRCLRLYFISNCGITSHLSAFHPTQSRYLCMTPSVCRSLRTCSTTCGGSCNILAMCSIVLLPSTNAKTCRCFRDQVFMIFFSTCVMRLGTCCNELASDLPNAGTGVLCVTKGSRLQESCGSFANQRIASSFVISTRWSTLLHIWHVTFPSIKESCACHGSPGPIAAASGNAIWTTKFFCVPCSICNSSGRSLVYTFPPFFLVTYLYTCGCMISTRLFSPNTSQRDFCTCSSLFLYTFIPQIATRKEAKGTCTSWKRGISPVQLCGRNFAKHAVREGSLRSFHPHAGLGFVSQTVTIHTALVLHERFAASVCSVVGSPPCGSMMKQVFLLSGKLWTSRRPPSCSTM